GKGEVHDEVGAREERVVDRVDEVGGGDEEHRGQLARDLVDAEHHGVGRAMYIHRIGLEGRGGAAHGEALDLVDEDHRVRTALRDLRDRVVQQPHDVALALAEHVARKGMRVDFEQRGRTLARERERRDLREAAGEGGLAGARRAGEHDEAVGQSRELRKLAPVLEGDQRLRQQALLHPGRDDDRVPVLVVVVGGQHVLREHARRQGSGRHYLNQNQGQTTVFVPNPPALRATPPYQGGKNRGLSLVWGGCHQLSGRRSSGHSICDTSCMLSSVSSASSNSTSGSVSARMVSRIESNMCTRTRRASPFGSSLKCWCQRKWSTTMRSPFFQRWCSPRSGAVPMKLWPRPSTT